MNKMNNEHNKNSKASEHSFRLKRYVWILAAIWTVMISASLYWSIFLAQQRITEVAKVQSRVAYEKDVFYRRWNANHRGVYVPVTTETQPNPHLAHVIDRDIATPSGTQLTLINPAYMTRQVHELALLQHGVLGHITSLNPIRKENIADKWETDALTAFERGIAEVSSLEEINGEEYLRLMRPLITEKGCLECHAKQGYKEGEIRGGISVSIPMQPLDAILNDETLRFELVHSFIWAFGLTLIFFGYFRIKKIEYERLKAEMEKEKFQGVIELAGAACHELNQPLQIISGFTSLITEEETKTDLLKNHVEKIQIEVERMGELTRKLQNISHYKTVDYLNQKIIDLEQAST